MKTKTTALSALVLIAVAALMPACDIIKSKCNPEVDICVFEGNHPSGLDPSGHP